MSNVIQPASIERTPNVVNMMFGSHLYGLDTPNSDIDYKGIYLPTLKELLLGDYPGTYKHSTGGQHEKNAAGDIDTEVVSLPKFLNEAINGETYAIDMLHCNEPISTSPLWEVIVCNRTRFYSKSMKAYLGYVKKQAAKYGLKGTRLACIRESIRSLEHVPLMARLGDVKDQLYYGEYAKWVEKQPKKETGQVQYFYEVNMKMYQSTNTVAYVLNELHKVWDSYGQRAKAAELNEGVDWKALSHALRAGYQARDIYTDGDFQYPLKETDFIKAVKLGHCDYKTEVAPALEALVDEVNVLADKSGFPDKVDRKWWEGFLINTYKQEFNISI